MQHLDAPGVRLHTVDAQAGSIIACRICRDIETRGAGPDKHLPAEDRGLPGTRAFLWVTPARPSKPESNSQTAGGSSTRDKLYIDSQHATGSLKNTL